MTIADDQIEDNLYRCEECCEFLDFCTCNLHLEEALEEGLK